jgi:hypothetical protein
VADPDGVIGRILGFLGLPAESGLSDYGAGAESMNSFRRSCLGDEKLLEHTHPHGRSVGRWQETIFLVELQELLAGVGTDTSLRIGYEEALADVSS